MDASAVNCQMQRTELQMDAVNEFKVNLFIETKIRNNTQMHIDDKSKNKKEKKPNFSLVYMYFARCTRCRLFCATTINERKKNYHVNNTSLL